MTKMSKLLTRQSATIARAALLSAVCCLTIGALNSNAVSLAWDSSPGATGYKYHYGTSTRAYTATVNVQTQRVVQLPILDPGVRHFLSVTAYDASGAESAHSLEVAYTPPLDGVNAALIPMQMSVVRSPSPRLNFSLAGKGGQHCYVQSTTNFSSWITEFKTNLTSPTALSFVDTNLNKVPHRFFRAVASPP